MEFILWVNIEGICINRKQHPQIKTGAGFEQIYYIIIPGKFEIRASLI